ncbi:unnamed protein product [Nippostrongylus brasiliensis]|uniref:EFTUD2 domain-containing protein n=1 Tax=Nippostrongylus brasiliensis TaxID=27835 RepID=A0A0N4YBI4_NIPBR|nr:unnamed protein product [Nippostrongylus brasiliensis]
MSSSNLNVDDLNEGIDELFIESDTEATDGIDGDDMAPALAPDTDKYDLDTSEDDEETEYTWYNNGIFY